MGTGASIFLLALGAVLTFAVETDSTEGINVNNVGVILMVAGALGLVIYALVWGRRDQWNRGGRAIVEEHVVQAPPVVRQRVVSQPVVEEQVVTSRPVVERRTYE